MASPGGAPAGPDRAQAGERLGEVRVDGREREAAQALELTRAVAVVALRAVVQRPQRQQREQQPGQPVGHDHQHAQQPKHVGQQDVEHEGQRVVHQVHVRREAVEHAAQRRGVEEGHCGLLGKRGKGIEVTRLKMKVKQVTWVTF